MEEKELSKMSWGILRIAILSEKNIGIGSVLGFIFWGMLQDRFFSWVNNMFDILIERLSITPLSIVRLIAFVLGV